MKRLLFLWLLLAPSAWASLILPVNIEKLATNAQKVFMGTVLGNEEDYSGPSGIPAIRTRVRVEEMFKGVASTEIVIRQAAKKGPGGKLEVLFYGMPRFTPGDRVVVFLPKPSSIGFASPLALGQGVFRFLNPAKPYNTLIANESGNQTLFHGVKNTALLNRLKALGISGAATTEHRPFTLVQLKDLVRAAGGNP
ncbi:MAG: hypothetical protein V1798_07680 [Pseudomonadota bacterium]